MIKLGLRVIVGILLTGGVALAAPISPVGTSGINNSAAPQNAQFNVGTGTVRGPFWADRIQANSLAVGSFSALDFYGGGGGLLNLNASELMSGIVPAGRLSGAYPNLTGVGTISTGEWRGTVIGTQYGGTGQNWSAIPAGNIPVFTGLGIMGALPAGSNGFLLQSTGSGFAWTGAPSVLGTNILDIPLNHLLPGTLPSNIAVTDVSISSVSAVKVHGDIPGKASGLTTLLPISGLAAGQLPTTIPASSITVTGVIPKICGNPTYSCQLTIGADGRIYKATAYQIPGVSTGPYVVREVPTPVPDGINDTFYLSTGAAFGSESVYVNGILQQSGPSNDYVLTNDVLVFNAGSIPPINATILVSFCPPGKTNAVVSVPSGPWKAVRYVEFNSDTGYLRISFEQ